MPDQNKKRRSLALAGTTILFLPSMLLARFAAQSCINTITIDSETVSKRRVWYANLLRIPGNLILSFRRAPVKVLTTKRWFEREQLLSDATVSQNELTLKKLDGIPLCRYLADEESVERKLAAISAATRSLFEFHLQNNQSHGDASAANVMIHEQPGGFLSATWFDFDVAHNDSVSDIVRRADDLRALLFTSKKWLTTEEFSQLFAGSESPYADEEVWKELTHTMSNPFQHCDIFHLAQLLRAKASPDQSS
jgi:hypothetical protein